MAMAGARFAESLLKAAQGQKGVIEPTFIDSPLYKDQGIDFFSSKVELGPNGVEKIHEVGKITEYEQKLLDVCLKDLKGNIAKGIPKSVQQASELMLIYHQASNLSRKTRRAIFAPTVLSLFPRSAPTFYSQDCVHLQYSDFHRCKFRFNFLLHI